jgi:hypothetical protein
MFPVHQGTASRLLKNAVQLLAKFAKFIQILFAKKVGSGRGSGSYLAKKFRIHDTKSSRDFEKKLETQSKLLDSR